MKIEFAGKYKTKCGSLAMVVIQGKDIVGVFEDCDELCYWDTDGKYISKSFTQYHLRDIVSKLEEK